MPTGTGVSLSCNDDGGGGSGDAGEDIAIVRVSYAQRGFTTIHFTVTYNYTTHQVKVISYNTGNTNTGGTWHQQTSYGQAVGLLVLLRLKGIGMMDLDIAMLLLTALNMSAIRGG